MTLRRVLAVVAWTLVVLACSGAVWGVIRTAGTGVTSSPSLPPTTTSAGPTPDRTTPSLDRPHRRAHPSASARSRSATPAPSAGATAPTATPPPASTADRPDRTGQQGSSQAQQPAEVRRTWQGDAGAVVASCRGATITFRGAQPNSGWRVEVGNRGPQQVEVNFSTRQDDGGEVELRARCVGGEPRFSTSGD